MNAAKFTKALENFKSCTNRYLALCLEAAELPQGDERIRKHKEAVQIHAKAYAWKEEGMKAGRMNKQEFERMAASK